MKKFRVCSAHFQHPLNFVLLRQLMPISQVALSHPLQSYSYSHPLDAKMLELLEVELEGGQVQWPFTQAESSVDFDDVTRMLWIITDIMVIVAQVDPMVAPRHMFPTFSLASTLLQMVLTHMHHLWATTHLPEATVDLSQIRLTMGAGGLEDMEGVTTSRLALEMAEKSQLRVNAIATTIPDIFSDLG